MNRETIKLLAMLTMFCNHFACVFLEMGTAENEIMTDIGYFTAVTMCYFLVEGYHYTHSRKKYAQRLLVFGVISQIPYSLALGAENLNMMFTLFLCFLIIFVMENVKNKGEKTGLIIALVFCTTFTDWAWLAGIFTILFVWSKGKWKRTAFSYTVDIVLFGLMNLLSYSNTYPTREAMIHSLISCMGIAASGIVILCFYNGKCSSKTGKYQKWFFYLFYPLHLFGLWIVDYFFF
ncbi:MAG: TraX family protein [Dorea sp.]